MASKSPYPARLSRILTTAAHAADLAAAPAGTQLNLFASDGTDASITTDDRAAWISTHAPRLSPLHHTAYLRDYAVDDKIRRAKRAGDWPPISINALRF